MKRTSVIVAALCLAALLLAQMTPTPAQAQAQDLTGGKTGNATTATTAKSAKSAKTAKSKKAQPDGNNTYSKEEIKQAVEGFFAGTSEGLANIIEKCFNDLGRPVGYITGGEGGGAFIVGLRYGEGTLHLKNVGERYLYWQGPSAGWDFGGDLAKNFTLVYGMTKLNQIYKRYPGVDGSAYLVGGFSLNYQRRGPVTLAPIRSGVGLRLGANVGYLDYTKEKSINPF